MPPGRPSYSLVRERLKEMLFIAGKLTAYDAHKHYVRIFAKTSQRNVYYQLQKGVEKEEFQQAVVEEEGDYSWGSKAKKVYYSLAKEISVQIQKEVKEYFDSLKK
jgi:hypothetical protein